MKVLFITSEHPQRTLGGLGTFTREYVKELRKYCSVVVVYFHLQNTPPPEPDSTVDYVLVSQGRFKTSNRESLCLEAAASFRSQLQPIINIFNPDVIHCNDRQTYLPFRFDKNVFYSSHLLFCDLISMQGLDDSYFNELKIERTALRNSCVTAFYSKFAYTRGANLMGNKFNPVILPLGFNPKKFKNSLELKEKDDKKIRVAYFGRFENLQKGFMDFIKAVNLLGKEFKEKNNVEYYLYGSGEVSSDVDLSLFNPPDFLSQEDLYDAYSKMDIVVMPSRYEPFGLTGLEAMASACLLLVTSGLGMDEYARPGKNCLGITNDKYNISNVLSNAIENIDSYKDMRIEGRKSVQHFTWTRCVKAHMFYYSQISQRRFENLFYTCKSEVQNLISELDRNELIKKQYEKNEEDVVDKILSDLNEKEKTDKKILIITSNYEIPETKKGKYDVICISKTAESGVLYRPECLPFNDKTYDYVFAVGVLNYCIDVECSVNELFRISSEKVFVLYKQNDNEDYQTYKIENDSDLVDFINAQSYLEFNFKGSDVSKFYRMIEFSNLSEKEKLNNKCVAY